MSRGQSIFATAVFLFLAPGTVAGLIPWWISGWRLQPAFFGLEPLRWLGVLLILLLGLPVLLESCGRFAVEGLGTPAPVLPTQHLVVRGFYRYVRNPMYVAVTSIILGQALLLGNGSLLLYAILAWAAFHGFVLLYEEPKLRKTYGAEYDNYRTRVRRWIPRVW
ncbi:MAG TPA: isoprenylcysteine carboxylmethyltransferase family protein [Bryobacteraceae bacterium]|nr:isoprenylcysteine carboxylmethyltransferase family protein [Bryobacteraceae bacterium]